MIGSELQTLIAYLSKLPGLGPRSGRRCALYLMKNKERLMQPLTSALQEAAEKAQTCHICYNLDTIQPCSICSDPKRDKVALCIVEDVDDVWAIERSQTFYGRYFVLGGVLSALEGKQPADLHIPELVAYVQRESIEEVILALSATVDGQTTAHLITAELRETGAKVTALSHGIPIGGELDYMDDGTLAMAFQGRRSFQ